MKHSVIIRTLCEKFSAIIPLLVFSVKDTFFIMFYFNEGSKHIIRFENTVVLVVFQIISRLNIAVLMPSHHLAFHDIHIIINFHIRLSV